MEQKVVQDQPPIACDVTQNSRALRNVLISGIAFAAALMLAVYPDAFDRPVTGFINGFVGRSAFFDRLMYVLFTVVPFPGVILMALVWFCWFDTKELERRSHILVGTSAACGAGAISRFLQHRLPTHPRPFYDPALGFTLPHDLVNPMNTWNSFPSDHVTVFAGIAIVICIARPSFALAIIAFTALAELPRAYVGAHYPSDLLGGAALASSVIWATQTRSLTSLGSRIVLWERRWPSLFYMCAFLISYQIVTLGLETRWAAHMLLHDGT